MEGSNGDSVVWSPRLELSHESVDGSCIKRRIAPDGGLFVPSVAGAERCGSEQPQPGVAGWSPGEEQVSLVMFANFVTAVTRKLPKRHHFGGAWCTAIGE